MSVTIKATYNIPSKKELWLVEVTDINKQKFCGKNGQLLSKYIYGACSKYDDTYQRVISASKERKYLIASVDNVSEEEANFTFKKIQKFSVSADDISYQFTFGFGNEIYAQTLDTLKKKVQEKLEGCKKHIAQSKKSEKAISKLLSEFNAHLKNSASQSLTGEPNCGLKKTTMVDNQ